MENFNTTKLFIQVIINILLISIFLAIFFFTYAKNEEDKIFANNIKYLSDDLLSTIKLSGPNTYAIIKKNINAITIPDLSKEDTKTITNNNNILKNAIITNVIFFVVISLIVYFSYSYSDKSFSLTNILIQNFIILIFVGLTEFSILTYFFSEYISVDPNTVKLAAINKF